MASAIKEMAKLTGLSVATISKYINGGNVKGKNRIIIEEVLKDNEFSINEFARGLKTNKSNTIGVIIPHLNEVFATTILVNIENTLIKHGYAMIVTDSGSGLEQEADAVKFLLGKRVDCIIALSIASSGEHFKKVTEKNIPIVFIDHYIEGVKGYFVLIDNYNAMYQATQKLIDFGHKNIGFIGGYDYLYTLHERFKGYQACLKANGIVFNPNNVIKCSDSARSGYEHAKQLLGNKSRPTAVVAANYYLTLGLIMAINELNLTMPDDISVVAVDSLELSHIVKPKLWLVEQPLELIAEEVTDYILNKLVYKNEVTKEKVVLSTKLYEGNSIKKMN